MRGYLAGSLDLVAASRGAGGAPRFAVLDYKTNWLGRTGRAADHLAPPPRSAAGGDAAQALRPAGAPVHGRAAPLPALAAAGYDPDEHLGGVLYLFLRGMIGPDTPIVDGAPCGVFAWRPPGALVEALSDVLDGAPA